MKHLVSVALVTLTLTACASDPVIRSFDGSQSYEKTTVISYYLPTAYVPVEIKREDCKITITPSQPTLVPDETYRYDLSYTPAAYSYDTIDVKTDATGLLISVNATAENQSGAIINKLFELSSTIRGAATHAVALNAPAAPKTPCTNFVIHTTINPYEAHRAVSTSESVEIAVDPAPYTDIASSSSTRASWETRADVAIAASPIVAPECRDRDHPDYRYIYYRRPHLVHITITAKNTPASGDSSEETLEFVVLVPDKSRTACIPVMRKPVTKLNVALTFDHGILTGYKSDDPSPILATLQFPIDIIKGVIGLDTSGSGSPIAQPPAPPPAPPAPPPAPSTTTTTTTPSTTTTTTTSP